MFEGMQSMRVTTVDSVAEQNTNKIRKIEISYYKVYSIDTTSFTPPHTLTIPLLLVTSTTSNKTQ